MNTTEPIVAVEPKLTEIDGDALEPLRIEQAW